MHHSFNVLVLNTLLHVLAFSKCQNQGVRYEHAEMVPNVVKSRERWELYIVTDGIMVRILLGERWELCIVTDGVMVGILLGEGWELYIVTDGVMVRILLGEGSQCEKWVVFWRLLFFNQ
jgi:hypothetical protein